MIEVIKTDDENFSGHMLTHVLYEFKDSLYVKVSDDADKDYFTTKLQKEGYNTDEIFFLIPTYSVLEEDLRCTEQELKDAEDKIMALESELKEVLDVLLEVSPKKKDWVMKNWASLYKKD